MAAVPRNGSSWLLFWTLTALATVALLSLAFGAFAVGYNDTPRAPESRIHSSPGNYGMQSDAPTPDAPDAETHSTGQVQKPPHFVIRNKGDDVPPLDPATTPTDTLINTPSATRQ